MKLLTNTKRWIKYGWKANHLHGDKKDIRGNNQFIIFDTGLYAENLGDWIINEYCQKEFSKMGINIIHRIPTQSKVTEADNKFLLDQIDTGKIITGTNVLCNHVFDSNQWQKPIIDKRLSHLILMGVGVDNYEKKMDDLTKKFYRTFLDGGYLHSVRDSISEMLLKSIGIENVVNTACPTMWNLTPDFCRKINRYKTDDVITTVTEYDRSPIDFAVLDLLLEKYRKVYLWLQGEKDLPYIKMYKQYNKLKIVDYSLSAYNDVLKCKNIEYVGTRLHGGIHALNQGLRTLIIAVDGRGQTIGKDTNLPTIKREEAIDKLESLILMPRETYISLPMENIELWRKSITGKQ